MRSANNNDAETASSSFNLLQFRKKFTILMKNASTYESKLIGFDELLQHFCKIMSTYTPDELAIQFKELISFTHQICDILVTEIHRRVNNEDTREAAYAVDKFLSPFYSDSRGWILLKSLAFILNSGYTKVFEPIFKTKLPSVFVKVFNLFFELISDAEQKCNESRQKLYDLLVPLMNLICNCKNIGQELIQKDDLVWLFISSSIYCESCHIMWRDANFNFLFTIIEKGLTSSVIKYIHSKGCLNYYLKNLQNSNFLSNDKSILICNLLDLLSCSALTTKVLIDDFTNANGYQMIIDFCVHKSTKIEEVRQIFVALINILTAGTNPVTINQVLTLPFYNFNLSQPISNCLSTVRNYEAFLVFKKCFDNKNSELALLVLENILNIYKMEPLNYFILDKYYSFDLFVEKMLLNDSKDVQKKIFEIIEFILREINYMPFKELTSINTHLNYALKTNNYSLLRRFLCFLFQILSINISVKDAFRELLIIESFLNIIQKYHLDLETASLECCTVTQTAMDLLVSTTKGNVLNAQFVTENFEMKVIKSILLSIFANKSKLSTEIILRLDEFQSATIILIKNLLFLAKNEQLFSSLLQLLFSDPSNIPLCVIISKLFSIVLLESHKVRIMFRRTGGYICIMTLILHLENMLYSESLKFSFIDKKTTNLNEYSIRQILNHISLIFRVLTVSMRYEPSNAKYFLTEVNSNVFISLLRCMGCFTQSKQINLLKCDIWEKVNLKNCKDIFIKFHTIFQYGNNIFDGNFFEQNKLGEVPPLILNALFIFRLLFDLALDNYEKPTNSITWAKEDEWLQGDESVESIPIFSFTSRTILVHSSAIICILELLPAINADYRLIKSNEINYMQTNSNDESNLSLWTASAQFYIALILKALMRSERNQQIMCQHGMAKVLLDVGAELFKAEKHPLLSSFYYLFERLACQSMHPRELRRFLRLDQPLCCLNLDDDIEENDKEFGGGPVPIHRVKALVSMLTPRNHSLVHPPAFVEFDLSIEGFACLFIPSISNVLFPSTNNSLNLSSTNERIFPPLNGFTFMTWFYVDEYPLLQPKKSTNSPPENSIICLLNIVRNFDGSEAQSKKREFMPNIENQLTCFCVQLNMADRCLLVSTAEHSVVDELKRDFKRPPETFVQVPLSEQYFHTCQWVHLTVVLSRALLKQSQVDIYINGKCLLSQKLSYIQANVGGAQAQFSENQSVHAIVGTLPFFRRFSNLRWKMSSLYLIEEPISIDTIQKIILLQPHYIGNLQTRVNSSILVVEDKILLTFNAKATTEITLQTLRSMSRKSDCEMIASLLGISVNDNSTPLRLLWNTATHANGIGRALCAVVIGYLGMRTFAPCPVSSLLDSIGGVAPLLGLIAMCTDSHGLYASLKVLVSSVQTNNSIVNSLINGRGYQTLAMLLEDKAHLINSHILHLVLLLAGTVDVSKENTIISNAQTFEDLLCDLDVWTNALNDVKKSLFEHFYELVIDDHSENLSKIRNSSFLNRLLIFIFEDRSGFLVRYDIVFRLIGAIVQPPCDAKSLLRLGQTISATLFLSDQNDRREKNFPFYIAELERLLLKSLNNVTNDEQTIKNQPEFDEQLYAVYIRNRLLNIISTTLAHSSGQFNNRLCELIVNTLGFGWILSLCVPDISDGTLYLALRILVNILKYPLLMEKFRDGTANSGWLSDADSVIRNRAAVVLGFSVAAHNGAVGSHVDINPELANCSGFAALEHLMYAHANKPFTYLAILAILFGQYNANIQHLDEFNVDTIWSHVFSLKENGSVADAIKNAQFCPDILISLFSMIRACLNHQKLETNESSWCHNYPLIIMQLITFLYQNSEFFFVLSHTETFVVSLFSTLISPNNSQTNCSNNKTTNLVESRSERLILELLTNILLNDLCLPHESRTEWPFDALVEFLDSGGSMCSYQSVLYTELVNACLDRFMSSNMFFTNVSLISSEQICQTSESTALNVIHFLSKVIDSVWNCLYRGNPIQIFRCFLKLLSEAHVKNKAVAQITCTEIHLNALFRIVLYLISRPIDNVDTQMSVCDTLAEIVRNQHLLLSKNANNSLFFGALVHLVFMLSEKPNIQTNEINNHLEQGTAQVSMCAQTVWSLLWQQKKTLLDEIFKQNVDLDLYIARGNCGEIANRCWLQFVDSQTDCSTGISQSSHSSFISSQTSLSGRIGNSAAAARANVGQIQQNIESKLTRVAKNSFQRLTSRKLGSSVNATTNVQPAFHFERLKIEPETFYMWIRVHITLLHELMINRCKRYHEWHVHVRKWCLKKWHNTEAELTRERGLWGPEMGSYLDKYELDVTEGPHRIRKKLLPNNEFYQHYPYRPYLERPEAKSLKAKAAISKDSKTYYEKMRLRRFYTMDDRIIDETTNIISLQHNEDQILDLSTELNMSIIKRMMQKNLTLFEQKDSENEKTLEKKHNSDNENSVDDEADLTTDVNDHQQKDKQSQPFFSRKTSQSTIQKNINSSNNNLQGPDNQTLLRLLEEGEQLHSMFRCARIQGLDTLEGLLLFGKDYYYVVDGFTLLKTREIRDLDFLPEQYHDPIVPYMAMGCSNRPSTRSNRQCSKFSYDDIKEVHKRRYLLQPIALEVFSADGRNYLLAFPRKIRDRVYQKFVLMAKNSSSDVARTMAEQRKLLPAEASSAGHQFFNQLMGQQSMTQRWQRGEITNFYYLMYLNTLAGRSYNDLSQYPVFPWILADYNSEKLNLTNPATFRDLSKPMGAQSTKRLLKFLKRYNEWDDPTGDTPSYMFGTHYSSAMIVLSYLVRLEPFTKQFLKLQGGHFDLADRMFHSISDAYASASCNNMADVRELIPEFFYLPEMLLNLNNFDLGIKQNGVMLHHVQLPKWAHDDPHEFIRLHREALECDYVSEHLHEWIDLIFGFKQNGDAARDANNIFHHLFYEENVNFDVIEDPLTRNATLGFINNFGQIPSQLFKKPHPQKRVIKAANASLSVTSSNTNNITSNNVVSFVPGVTTQKLFYHCLSILKPSTKPVKELKTAVGDIVINEKNQVIVLEQNKIFLPPNSYLAWGFYDHSIRFGTIGSEKSEHVLETSDVYEITCMATTDGKTIFAGLTTGIVLVWSIAHTTNNLIISSFSATSLQNSLITKKALDAHTDVVTALAICSAHNFFVSASRDKSAVIWHLTKFSFIRQLTGHPAAVTAIAVNESTGDIATASNSFLCVWSINGNLLAVVNTASESEPYLNTSTLILCISFSILNEWDVNNVIMCGTNDGLVKIYSMRFIKNKINKNEEDNNVLSVKSHQSNSHLLFKHNILVDSTKEAKEHILKRQQRIQQHYQRMMSSDSGSGSVSGINSSIEQRIVDSSQTSSSISKTLTLSNKTNFNEDNTLSLDSNNDNNFKNDESEDNESNDNGCNRVLILRRVFSKHTGFNRAANAQPAPITSVQTTRDHKSILVGDGVGRVWLWTIDQN